MIFARIRRWDSCWFPGSTKHSQTLVFWSGFNFTEAKCRVRWSLTFFWGEEPPRSHRIDDVQTGCNAIRILVDFSTFGWFRFTPHNGTKQNDAKWGCAIYSILKASRNLHLWPASILTARSSNESIFWYHMEPANGSDKRDPLWTCPFYTIFRLHLDSWQILCGAHVLQPQRTQMHAGEHQTAHRRQNKNVPASCKWPFDDPNGGHLSPENVTPTPLKALFLGRTWYILLGALFQESMWH